MAGADAVRDDIIADTHGDLSKELLAALEGADVIVHAGDCCSISDYECLRQFCRVVMCVGNNDWGIDYGPEVKRLTRAFMSGMRWQVCHYEDQLDLETCDIAICGHTHRPFVRKDGNVLVMNPGSPTYPRTRQGPTMGRIVIADNQVQSAKIIQLEPERGESKRKRLFGGLGNFF